mgnify:FL=1
MKKLLTLLLIVIVAGFAFAFPAFHSVNSGVVAASGSTTLTFTDLNPLIQGSDTNYFKLDEIWVTAIGVLTHTTTVATLTTDTASKYTVTTVPDNNDMAGTLKLSVVATSTVAWDIYWDGTKVATASTSPTYGGIVITYTGTSANTNDLIEFTFARQTSSNDFVVSYTFNDIYIIYKSAEDRLVASDLVLGHYVPYSTTNFAFTITNSETYRCKYKVIIQTDE